METVIISHFAGHLKLFQRLSKVAVVTNFILDIIIGSHVLHVFIMKNLVPVPQ